MVGRGASFILGERPNVLRLRLVAPLADRVSRIAQFQNLSDADARRAVLRTDQERRLFIRSEFQADWEDPTHYDLVMNTSGMGVTQAVEVAIEALRRKTGA